jgi:hypothetical protein
VKVTSPAMRSPINQSNIIIMKEYTVPIIKSDKVFTVKAYWKKDHDLFSEVDSFNSEKEARVKARWWTDKSSNKDYIQSVEINQVIRLMVAK